MRFRWTFNSGFPLTRHVYWRKEHEIKKKSPLALGLFTLAINISGNEMIMYFWWVVSRVQCISGAYPAFFSSVGTTRTKRISTYTKNFSSSFTLIPSNVGIFFYSRGLSTSFSTRLSSLNLNFPIYFIFIMTFMGIPA